jgi:uncharacterized iron-regulated membrane protein
MASVKASLRRVHRYVALALAVLWVSQALTGLLMVFRWELSDAVVSAPDAPLDVDALGARIAAINAGPTGQSVYQLYATGGKAGRFDLYVRDQAGDSDIVRVDGAGNVLRALPYGRDYANGGVIQAAATLHQTLFAGDTGKLIVGLSGVLLLASIVMGVVLAWPVRAGQWQSVLLPRAAKPGAARRYAWHRAAGLWLAVPAVVFITTGALMTIEHSLERWLGQDATPPELSAVAPLTQPGIGPAQAVRIALGRFPTAELSGAALPSSESPWYRIRVRQPQEWRRVYGTTVVYVAAADGRVLLEQDALNAPAARSFLSNLYPIHTGEVAGLPGRLLSLTVGAWLLAMLVLGLGLWWIRRR